jgi:hypothetical protein
MRYKLIFPVLYVLEILLGGLLLLGLTLAMGPWKPRVDADVAGTAFSAQIYPWGDLKGRLAFGGTSSTVSQQRVLPTRSMRANLYVMQGYLILAGTDRRGRNIRSGGHSLIIGASTTISAIAGGLLLVEFVHLVTHGVRKDIERRNGNGNGFPPLLTTDERGVGNLPADP